MTVKKKVPGTIPDKLQPNSVEAEQAVLGSILIDQDSILKISTILTPDDFFIERNGWIYEAIVSLQDRGEPIDILLICDELERQDRLEQAGGPAYLTSLTNVTPSSLYGEHYARIVERTAKLRRLIHGAGEIARAAYDSGQDADAAYDEAERILFGLTSQSTKTMPRPITEPVGKVMDTVNAIVANPGKVTGLPTGLIDLDRLLGGLQRSDFIILAGRPGMGKTSLGLSVALHSARKLSKKICIFSCEMSDEQLVQRLMSAETGIDSQRIRLGQIRDDEWSAFVRAGSMLSDTSIFIDDTPALSVHELKSKARRLHAERKLDLIIIDYLQLLRGDERPENRQQEISYISRSIKALARELNIPILALSQLSRNVEYRHDKRPILADLRESGSLEQDADVVMFIYRDDVYNPNTEFPNIAEIIVGKHRSGPTGIFSVYFKKHLAQFVSLEVNRQELEPIPPVNGNGKNKGRSPKSLDKIITEYHNGNGKNGNGHSGETFVIES